MNICGAGQVTGIWVARDSLSGNGFGWDVELFGLAACVELPRRRVVEDRIGEGRGNGAYLVEAGDLGWRRGDRFCDPVEGAEREVRIIGSTGNSQLFNR